MTGRELILYILKNNLEDEPVFKDGVMLGFIDVEEAAKRLGVGTATIYAWILRNEIDHVYTGKCFLIPANCELRIGGIDDQKGDIKTT